MTGSSSLRPHLLRSAAFLLPAAVSLLVLLVGMGFSILAGLSVVGGGGAGRPVLGPEAASALTLLGLGGIVVTGAAWAVSLFVPVREPLAEGGRRVENGAAGAVGVREAVRDHLERRCPSWTLRTDDIDGHPSLSVDDGDGTSAVLMARPVGPDLWIRWATSRSRSTSALVLGQFPGNSAADLLLLDADAAAAMAGLVSDAVEHAARSQAG